MIHTYVNSVSLDKMTSISTQAVAVLFALWVVTDSIILIYTFLAVDTWNLKFRESGEIFCVMAKYLEIQELRCSAEQWNRMKPKAPEHACHTRQLYEQIEHTFTLQQMYLIH